MCLGSSKADLHTSDSRILGGPQGVREYPNVREWSCALDISSPLARRSVQLAHEPIDFPLTRPEVDANQDLCTCARGPGVVRKNPLRRLRQGLLNPYRARID